MQMIYSVIVDNWYDTRYHVEYMGQRKVVYHSTTVPSAVLDFLKSGNQRSEAMSERSTIYYRKRLT
jgi:hypothetical protein